MTALALVVAAAAASHRSVSTFRQLGCPAALACSARACVRAAGSGDGGGSTLPLGAVAIDCEMVKVRRAGKAERFALGHVCVVDAADESILLETYVRPDGVITDYLTRYSGLSEPVLRGAPPYEEARAAVVRLLEGRLVIGHGLDSDFKALRWRPLDPSLVADTRHLPWGPRISLKLRDLARDELGLEVQSGAHSPVEDALAALRLHKRFLHIGAEEAARPRTLTATLNLGAVPDGGFTGGAMAGGGVGAERASDRAAGALAADAVLGVQLPPTMRILAAPPSAAAPTAMRPQAVPIDSAGSADGAAAGAGAARAGSAAPLPLCIELQWTLAGVRHATSFLLALAAAGSPSASIALPASLHKDTRRRIHTLARAAGGASLSLGTGGARRVVLMAPGHVLLAPEQPPPLTPTPSAAGAGGRRRARRAGAAAAGSGVAGRRVGAALPARGSARAACGAGDGDHYGDGNGLWAGSSAEAAAAAEAHALLCAAFARRLFALCGEAGGSLCRYSCNELCEMTASREFEDEVAELMRRHALQPPPPPLAVEAT